VLPPCTAKSNVALVQLLPGIVTISCADLPGESVPLGGLKVTPLRFVLADQFRSLCELGSSVKVRVHVQTLFELSSGQIFASELPTFDALTCKIGGCCTGPAAGATVKVTLTLAVTEPSEKVST
jgi:hypothetical protein